MQFPETLKKRESENHTEHQTRLLKLMRAPKKAQQDDTAFLNQFVVGRAIQQEGQTIRCLIVDELNRETEVLYNKNETQRNGIFPGDTFLRAVARFGGEYPVLWRKLTK